MWFLPLSAQWNMCWLTGALHMPVSCRYVDMSPELHGVCVRYGICRPSELTCAVKWSARVTLVMSVSLEVTLLLWETLGRKSGGRNHFVCLLLLIIQLLWGLRTARRVTLILLKHQFRPGLCDWQLGKMNHPGSLTVLDNTTKIVQIFCFIIKHYETAIIIIYL